MQALETLATKDDQALARLTDALNARVPEVRLAAVVSLESAADPRSPESNLGALTSKHADVRRSALLRLYRRGLLGEPAVQSAVRAGPRTPIPMSAAPRSCSQSTPASGCFRPFGRAIPTCSDSSSSWRTRVMASQ